MCPAAPAGRRWIRRGADPRRRVNSCTSASQVSSLGPHTLRRPTASCRGTCGIVPQLGDRGIVPRPRHRAAGGVLPLRASGPLQPGGHASCGRQHPAASSSAGLTPGEERHSRRAFLRLASEAPLSTWPRLPAGGAASVDLSASPALREAVYDREAHGCAPVRSACLSACSCLGACSCLCLCRASALGSRGWSGLTQLQHPTSNTRHPALLQAA